MKHIDFKNHAFHLLSCLCDHLHVKASRDFLRNALETHPQGESLEAISDVLNELEIENLAVKIPAEKITEIPLPALCFLTDERSKYFVVATRINDNEIKYFIDNRIIVKETISSFCSKWDGTTLLLSATEKSGEKDYTSSRRKENLNQIHRYSLAGLPILIFFLLVTSLKSQMRSGILLPAFILAISILGAWICALLAGVQFGMKNQLTRQFCNISLKANCTGVLNSAGSKFLGINLSEIGLIFFSGQAVSVASVLAFGPEFVGSIYLVVAIPSMLFAFFSLYYQKFVVKAWCPLCLAVVAILILTFAVLLYGADAEMLPGWSHVFGYVTSYAIVLWLWLVVRAMFLSHLQFPAMQKAYQKLKQNPRVISSLIESADPVRVVQMENEIAEGNPEAGITVTIVTDATCEPCRLAHRQVRKLLRDNPLHVKVIYRFVGKKREANSIASDVARTIIGLTGIGANEEALQMLHNWYSGERMSFDMWKSRSTHHLDLDIANEIYNSHIEWAREAGITSTPSFFINNKPLPKELSIEDLKYFVRAQVLTE